MKIITCKKGEQVLVDDYVYENIKHMKWCVWERGRNKYAVNSLGQKMHRIIMMVLEKPKTIIDHIDGNGLNNQKSNLRIATISENCCNSKKSKNRSSVYKGVCFDKKLNRYVVLIMKDRIRHYVGCYKTEYLAGLAYNKKAKELHLEFAKLNEPTFEDKVKMFMRGEISEFPVKP